MKTPDLSKAFQDMLTNMPIDTSSMQDAFKTQTAFAEKMAKIALDAAETSSEISANWVRDTLSRMGELTSAKDQPADYAKAVTDFTSSASERAAEHMQSYAEVAKKLQMQTVDLLLTAGKDIAEEAQGAANKMAEKTQEATRAATTARKGGDSAKS